VQDDPVHRPPRIGLRQVDADQDAEHFEALGQVGIDYDEVVGELERAGVASFIDAWNELLTIVETAQARV
jgi:transaldolase